MRRDGVHRDRGAPRAGAEDRDVHRRTCLREERGGAWGTALAVHAVAAHPTRLWARDAEQVKRMRSSRRNASYLPEVVLPPALQVGNDLDSALGYAAGGIVVVATPMAGLEPLLAH